MSCTFLCMFTLLLFTCSGHIYNSYRTHSSVDVKIQVNHIYQECQICAGADTQQMLCHEYISYIVISNRQTKIIVKIEENSILPTDIKFNYKHSPKSSWFNPRPVNMRCVINKVAMRQVFFPSTSVFICHYHSANAPYSVMHHPQHTIVANASAHRFTW